MQQKPKVEDPAPEPAPEPTLAEPDAAQQPAPDPAQQLPTPTTDSSSDQHQQVAAQKKDRIQVSHGDVPADVFGARGVVSAVSGGTVHFKRIQGSTQTMFEDKELPERLVVKVDKIWQPSCADRSKDVRLLSSGHCKLQAIQAALASNRG